MFFVLQEARKKGSKELILREGWPLCEGGRILIHLNPPSHASLGNGDSYFCLSRQADPRAAQLCLRHMRNGKVEEYAILEGDYNKIFTMDWLQNVNTRDPLDLVSLMEHCMAAAESGVRRMGWDRFALSPRPGCPPHESVDGNQNEALDEVNVRPKFLPSIQDTIRDITHEFKKGELHLIIHLMPK